jgi:hypothetical protein
MRLPPGYPDGRLDVAVGPGPVVDGVPDVPGTHVTGTGTGPGGAAPSGGTAPKPLRAGAPRSGPTPSGVGPAGGVPPATNQESSHTDQLVTIGFAARNRWWL